MMIDEASEALKCAITRFFVPLQTVRTIKEDAFEELHQAAIDLARALKGTEELPRSMLNELYVAVNILRAEAPHFGERAGELAKMADKLEYCFALILRGETCDDRRPGVPRII